MEIVVVTGVHPPCTEEDLDRMLGPKIVNLFSVINHSAWDEKSLIGLGTIGGGKSVQFQMNKHVAEANIKILMGMIGPHHAAGYSGGRKSVLPGVASFENIRNQHNLNPDRIMLGKLEDNPITRMS